MSLYSPLPSHKVVEYMQTHSPPKEQHFQTFNTDQDKKAV